MKEQIRFRFGILEVINFIFIYSEMGYLQINYVPKRANAWVPFTFYCRTFSLPSLTESKRFDEISGEIMHFLFPISSIDSLEFMLEFFIVVNQLKSFRFQAAMLKGIRNKIPELITNETQNSYFA